MEGMFKSAQEVTELDLEAWDVSQVSDFSAMFNGARKAVPSLTNWNTESATSMEYMFRAAVRANPDVGLWYVGKVKNFRDMFHDAKVARPNVTGWNVSAATSLRQMFESARLATPCLRDWRTAKVLDTTSMFENAWCATPSLGHLDLIGVRDRIDAETYWEPRSDSPQFGTNFGLLSKCADLSHLRASDGVDTSCPDAEDSVRFEIEVAASDVPLTVSVPVAGRGGNPWHLVSEQLQSRLSVFWGEEGARPEFEAFERMSPEDGGTASVHLVGYLNHTYTTPGTYQVVLRGADVPGWDTARSSLGAPASATAFKAAVRRVRNLGSLRFGAKLFPRLLEMSSLKG
eukprot:g5575.t1